MPEIRERIEFNVNYEPGVPYVGIYGIEFGFKGLGSVFVNSASLVPGAGGAYTAAHEISHAQRDALSELSIIGDYLQVAEAGPTWLDEGIAEFLAYHALSEGGVMPYEHGQGRDCRGQALPAAGRNAGDDGHS